MAQQQFEMARESVTDTGTEIPQGEEKEKEWRKAKRATEHCRISSGILRTHNWQLTR